MVRPQCCPCGSPIYNQREASLEWLFTHANCTRAIRRYSNTNTSRNQICCPSALHALRSHRPQFPDSTSDSKHFTMRPSQFYQKGTTPKGAWNSPSERNLRADSDKRGKMAGEHGMDSQLLTIVDDGARATPRFSNEDWHAGTKWIGEYNADSCAQWESGAQDEADTHCEKEAEDSTGPWEGGGSEFAAR